MNIYPDLVHAPLHTPLFIRHIFPHSLAERFSRFGLEEGVKIEIKNNKIPIRPMWVQTHSSRIILSQSLVLSLWVVSEKGIERSLMLLKNGEEGYVKGAFNEESDAGKLLAELGLRDGEYIKKISSLQVYDFSVEIKHGIKARFPLDDAVRILGSVDGHTTQLASVHLGQPFIVESIIDVKEPRAAAWKNITRGRTLHLKKLIPPNDIGFMQTAVHITINNHMHLCIQQKEAQQIRVGICEICWSCGECENL